MTRDIHLLKLFIPTPCCATTAAKNLDEDDLIIWPNRYEFRMANIVTVGFNTNSRKRLAIWSTFDTIFQTVVPPKLNTVLNTVLLHKKTVFNTVLLTITCKINPLP
jgi:hypothetical protein